MDFLNTFININGFNDISFPDLTRYQGLPGIYIANAYNVSDPQQGPQPNDDIETLITFNKGTSSHPTLHFTLETLVSQCIIIIIIFIVVQLTLLVYNCYFLWVWIRRRSVGASQSATI
jgi:hypothetical protein